MSAGHVFKRKGIEDFITVSKKIPQMDFFWFGTIYPWYLVDYHDIRDALDDPPQNLHFTGKYPDIIEAYCGSDYFFFPSHNENEGIVVLEAAAIGLPIIVRDIPVYEGWLIHEKNCLKANNSSEFFSAIQLLQKDRTLRKKLIKNAKKMVKARSLTKVAKQLRQAYESVL
jgi:1,2-diacylglycerol-3-alpha-glucose alpha-1,2-glucosyltransferase